MGKQEYSQENIDMFWSGFLKETNRIETTKYLEIFHFELAKKWANELLRLVLIGQKKATSSSLWGFEIEGENIPKVGEAYGFLISEKENIDPSSQFYNFLYCLAALSDESEKALYFLEEEIIEKRMIRYLLLDCKE